MMEGMTLSPQEGYIWAMRVNAYRESDSELWKERNSEVSMIPLKRTGSNKTAKKSSTTPCMDHSVKALATLIPDEIILNPHECGPKPFEACFLYLNFLGFTELSEKYISIGKGGPSRLTKVLNSYIGAMIQEILAHNGDILKFTANSFIVMWKCHYGQPMQDCVHLAIDCAVLIQKNHAMIVTDVDTVLSVSMIISAGAALFAVLGNETTSHHIIIGQSVWEVKRILKERNPGDIAVSPNAWHFINPSEYLYEYMNDGMHVKVMGVGPNWRSTQKSQSARDRRHPRHRDMYNEDKPEEVEVLESSSSEDDINEIDETEEFILRPVMNVPSFEKTKESLRKFVNGPVLTGIDMDEPLEYLTEIRKVVILCLNVRFRSISDKDSVLLLDNMYETIFSLIEDMKGCINEVQAFENNVTFKILFGFRGYKQMLESQIALFCAQQIYKKINKVGDPIKYLSIGITTGMSYCGVVGHSLRREYLVISTIERKAIGIMQMYPEKITCDRATYIHSKLDSSCFILQEHIAIPEVVNPGPIYAYSEEINKFEVSRETVNMYPALGRDEELAFYIYHLNTFLIKAKERVRGVVDKDVPSYKSAYFIEGSIRSGKSRLLEEMIYFTTPEIPVLRIRFDKINHRYCKVPFDGIKKILYPFLHFTVFTSEAQREQELMKRLSKMRVPELLCCINEIFNVNFKMTTLYKNLHIEKKAIVQQKMIKQLFFGCFPEPWIIAIDNACLMDDESWNLLKEVLNMDIVFMLVSLNADDSYVESEVLIQIKHHPRVFFLRLSPIDEWFHIGIACQVLMVQGIPIELERAIQEHSHGNPGYIESFLISLVQAGGVVYRDISKTVLQEIGLVEPSPEMLTRVFDSSKYDMLEAVANEIDSTTSFQKRGDVVDWKMFHHCYRKEVNFETKLARDRKVISVVFLTPTFELCKVPEDHVIDVLTLKTIDNLSSFERNILKCGSVLGDMFTRLMLYYVMNIPNTYDVPKTATAIKKLFEMRILACAQGDFTPGEDNTMDCFLIFKNRFIVPVEEEKVACYCKGISLPENLVGYPKYSYCGYMRFVLPSFKEITNSLLIDKQRKELNSKAVRYLEKEMRRCKPCGGGFFVKFMGKRYDDGLKALEEKTQKHASRTSVITSNSNSTGATSKPSSANIDARHLKSMDTFSASYDNRANRRMPSECFIMPKCTHPKKIKLLRAKYSITRTFSGSDFSGCYCFQILDTMYTRMLRHAYESELRDKIIDAMLEYSYVCIVSRNIPLAIIILSDAYHMLEDENIIKIQEEEWRIRLLRAKIKSLQGYSRHQFGQPEEAYKLFHQAMKYYGYPFPTTNGAILWSLTYKSFVQKIALYYIPKFLQKSMRDYQSEYCENLSECLGYMYDLFRERQLWLPAELAATWALNRALMSNIDFYRLAIAYTDMLEVELHHGNHKKCIILEVHALQLCHRKKTSIEDCELRAVTKMYSTIFRARATRSEIERAINIGYTMLHICGTVSSVDHTLQFLPLFIYILMYRRRISEVVTLLYELDFYSEEDSDSSGKTWFYGIGLVVQIFTGYTMLSYQFCYAFARIEGENLVTYRDPNSSVHFFTIMWLWCVRTENWEQASVWYLKIYNTRLLEAEDNLINIISAVAVLEGLMIYLVLRINSRNIKSLQQMYIEIDLIFNYLKKKIKFALLIRARYHLFKAYYRAIRTGPTDSSVKKSLNKARKWGNTYGNGFVGGWIDHNEKAWQHQLPRIQRDFWRNHCDGETQVDCRDLDDEDPDLKLGYYSLPLPPVPLD